MTAVVLHQRRWNPGGGRRALLLHGLGSDGATMWRIAQHLAAQGFDVLAPDLRGHGLSPPAGAYAVRDYARDVAALGSGWDVAIGHSLGGAVLATLLPQAGFARRAVLLDPVLALDERGKEALLPELVAEVDGSLSLDVLRSQQPRWDDEDVHRKLQASSRTTPAVVRRTLADTDPWDFVADALRWPAPVLLLAADAQRGALLDPALRLALSEAASVTSGVVAGAGHSVHRDDPDAVLAAIDEHLGARGGGVAPAS